MKKDMYLKAFEFIYEQLKRYFETNVYFTPKDVYRLKKPSQWKYLEYKTKKIIIAEALIQIHEQKIATGYPTEKNYYFKSLIYDDNVYVPKFILNR